MTSKELLLLGTVWIAPHVGHWVASAASIAAFAAAAVLAWRGK